MTQLEKFSENDVLQERLYLLQTKASELGRSFYIILEGWAQTGKGQILKTATYRMDPKKLKVYSPLDTETWDSKYPFQYKYWYHFPPKGTTFILLKSWYYRVSFGLQNGDLKKSDLEKTQKSIFNLERTLSDDGIYLVKFFLDLDRDELSKRLKKAEKEGKTWEVTKEDKNQVKDYNTYQELFQSYRRLTDQPFAPWIIIEEKDTEEAERLFMIELIRYMEEKLGVDSLAMYTTLMTETSGEIE